MTITINPEKLAKFDTLNLDRSSHSNFEQGHCAMEVVSWLADEGFTDAPECASNIVRRYTIALNDRWDDEKRQQLKPYLLRMIGTGSDGKEAIRERIATKHALSLLPDLLRLAGMEDQIAALDAVEPGNWTQMRKTLWAVRDAAYAKRTLIWSQRREAIRIQIEAELKKRNVAVAAADAAADAVAATATAAVAVAVAAAAAAADAVAATATATAAAAVAVAAAAAATAAVAAADAAAATAAATAAVDLKYPNAGYWKVRQAAYDAARKVYDEAPELRPLRDLAARADSRALVLLDRLIDANEED